MTTQAYISEVFPSIQGEGIYIGERQIFVRFIGCNISCEYCDLESIKRDQKTPCILKNHNDIKKINNPVQLNELTDFISGMAAGADIFHSISLTGGEPLLQVDFLKEFLPKFKMKKYLETNGILFTNLEEIIDLIDIIAMDIKLPSATGCSPYFEEHKKFLNIARLQDVFVKIVFTSQTTIKEIIDAAALIADEDPKIPLILQPVTVHRGFTKKATAEQCLNFQSAAKKKLERVLVIPQAHKVLGLD